MYENPVFLFFSLCNSCMRLVYFWLDSFGIMTWKKPQKSPIKKSYNLLSRMKCQLIATTPVFSVANVLCALLVVLLQINPLQHIIWIMDVVCTYFSNTGRMRTSTLFTTIPTRADVWRNLVLPGETSAAATWAMTRSFKDQH